MKWSKAEYYRGFKNQYVAKALRQTEDLKQLIDEIRRRYYGFCIIKTGLTCYIKEGMCVYGQLDHTHKFM